MPTGEIEAFTASFTDQHRVQWNAFVKKIGEEALVDAFGNVVEEIKAFAMPILFSLARGEKLTTQWKAGERWVVP